MGRRKKYDRDTLISTAKKLFQKNGYEATSSRALEKAMDINSFSFYSEFGSKRDLYTLALKSYLDNDLMEVFRSLLENDSGIDNICSLLDMFASVIDSGEIEYGCLLCSSASEQAIGDADSQGVAKKYFDTIEAIYSESLANAIRLKEIPVETNISQWAQMLTTTSIGIFVMIRSQTKPVQLKGSVQFLIDQLQKLKNKRMET